MEPSSVRSQRWRERRANFVGGSAVIDPREYAVDVISCTRQAKPFVIEHHYSGTFPATRLSCGLFRSRGRTLPAELVGVCSFAVPVNNASVPLQTGFEAHRRAVDLGRLVLLDDVPANGESWFVSRAFRLMRQNLSEVEAVIAYSDPLPRTDETGLLTMPGHVGMVYQALSARFRGRSSPRSDLVMPNGAILSPRALSKLRSGEVGAAYAARQLTTSGAPIRQFGEEPTAWIKRLEAQGFLQRRRHPGNLIYTFPLTRAAKLAERGKPALPYPTLAHDAYR